MRLILMLVGVALMMVVALAAGRLGSATEQAMSEVLRAELLMIAGEDDKAERLLRRAIRRQPLLGAAHHMIGRLRLKQGRPLEARRAFIDARRVVAETASVGSASLDGWRTATSVIALDEAATTGADSRRG